MIDKFLKAFEHVARVRGRIENARPDVRALPPRRELNDVIEFFSEMEAVVRETENIQLAMPAKYARRLLERAESGAIYSSLERDIEQLTDSFLDHFEERKVLLLDASLASYYDQQSEFIDLLSRKFPDAAGEFVQAGKCLALGLDTACAFHAIRAVEAAIVAMMRCLSVEPRQRNWGEYLKVVRENIVPDRGKPTSRTWVIQSDAQLFQDFLTTLQTLKRLYRDPTMHIEKSYSPAEARKIYDQTSILMEAVANRMDANGEPKA